MSKSLSTRKSVLVILSLFFALLLAVSMLLIPKRADGEGDDDSNTVPENADLWDGDLAAAGWGSEEVDAPDTYATDDTNKKIEIGSAAALAYFAHEVYYDSTHTLDGYTVTLTADIDLGGDANCWVPIGTTKRSSNPTKRFAGTFNGAGHTIYNLSSKKYYDNIKYDATDGYYVDAKGDDTLKIPFENDNGEFTYGLFGVTANITVRNLTLSNVQFDFEAKQVNGVGLVPDNVGAIIGHNEGWLNVINCASGKPGDGSLIKIKTNGDPAIGGLVGRAYARKQSGSATTYHHESVKIENCKNYTDIKYEPVLNDANKYSSKVSGILGFSNSYRKCEILSCANYGNLDGGQFVAGMMAYMSDNSNNYKYDDATERNRNAWFFNVDKCVNYGNITATNLDSAIYGGDGKTYAGGIVAYAGASGDNNASIFEKVQPSGSNEYVDNQYYNKLPAVNIYVTNCINYGTVKVYNTEAKNSGDGKGYNVAGGIVGMFTPTETGENKLTNNYNYGNVESIAKADSTYYTPRMGGYLGWLYYSWRTNGWEELANRVKPEDRPIKLTITGGSCGQVVGEDKKPYDGKVHVANLIGDKYTYPDKKLADDNYITLVYANNGKDNITRGPQPTGDASVTIDATTTEIEAAAYFGQSELTDLSFAENSTLAKIGDWAFAGTGLTQVNLPASVTEIGAAAFDSDVIVIAKNKAHYDALKASDKVSDNAKALLTYPIAVEYRYLDIVFDTVYKLHGKPYEWVLGDDNKWVEQENVELGTSKTETGAYWHAVGNSAVLTVEDVSELLNGDVETLVLETYALDKKVFLARTNLVYDGTEYDMTELNSLLQATCDRILPTMTASITSYVDPDNNAASDETRPTVICDAGTYTIKIIDGADVYEDIEIKIARATVDLGSYSNLSWRLTAIGQFDAANAELLDGNGVTLYIYTDSNGKEYPSRELLTDAQIAELGLPNGAYTTKTVLYSVVRNRNKNVTIEVVSNAKYTVGDYNDTNVGYSVGKYESTVDLTANKNYKFIKSAISTQRGMEVTVAPDGKTATVVKTWYIAEMSNWLVSSSGGDYYINDRVYGETTAVTAPSIRYGTADKISMTLRLNGTPIGSPNFGVADFGKYINRAMPAGSYELLVTVAGVESQEGDEEEGSVVTVYRSGFTDTILFNVEKAQLPSLANVNAALKGKTFTYTWDGSSHLYDAQAAQVVNAYLGASMPSRAGTIWADYNGYYGRFTITYNLALMQSDAYFGANDMTVATANPDKYTVYYRISAPNYYSSIEKLASGDIRQNYYFDVINIREIEVPLVSNVAYTGSVVYPTVTPAATGDEAFYDVLWARDGYLAGGPRTVSFKLRNSEYYCWIGEELGVDTVTVPFTVTPAANSWYRDPNIVGWQFEEFDKEINRIRAVPKFLDNGQDVKFTIKDSKGNAVEGLTDFSVNEDGTVSDTNLALISALNSLTFGSYTLEVLVDGTYNYQQLKASVEFRIGKASNTWADGEGDLVLPSWIVGQYSAKNNTMVVSAAHGSTNIIITDINGKEYYNSTTGLNKLNSAPIGKYLLKAWVNETENYAALAERTFTIEVFEKAGMPWWGTLLITLGALLVAALIIFILWKKGVFQILTGKIVLAIRNKATVEATIAAVRANKRAEEAKKSVEAAKRKEKLEERRAKAAEERALPAEQKAAALEEKAKKAAERAEKMKAKAEAMQLRAERMKEQAAATEAPEAEQPKAETPAEPPAAEKPVAEAAANEATATETPAEAPAEAPATEAAAAEEPVAEAPAEEAAATEQPKAEETAPKAKTPAKKKPSNKK